MKHVFNYALINALGTALYIALIGTFLSLLGGRVAGPDSFFAPVAFLMLLVFSVAVVSTLLFGRPAMWYVDGKKNEALVLLVYTLALFFFLTAVVFALLASMR